MDLLEEFDLKDIIYREVETVYIGKIREKDAVLTIPFSNASSGTVAEFLPKIVERFLSGKGSSKKGVLEDKCQEQFRLIYPASAEHMAKCYSSFVYEKESHEDYLKSARFLNTGWMDNVIESNAYNEVVHLNTKDYIVINDYLWDGKDLDGLYYLMIFKDPKYKSIRDINDLSLLVRAKNDALRLCAEVGLKESDISLHFHYRPSYFRLHLHILNISKTIDRLGYPGRNVFLDDVVRNLKIDKDFYQRDCYFLTLKHK